MGANWVYIVAELLSMRKICQIINFNSFYNNNTKNRLMAMIY